MGVFTHENLYVQSTPDQPKNDKVIYTDKLG